MFIPLFAAALLLSPCLYCDDTAHRVHNCEIEIEMLKNSLTTQEESREKLYHEMEESLSSVKKYLKEVESNSQEPKQKMTKTIQGLENDFFALKQHTNQLASKINELGASLSSMKKDIQGHAASLKSLEEAMTLLSKALSLPQKESSSSKASTRQNKSEGGKYVVQSGDSLEKIAKKHGMTITQLKERNHLSSSVIRSGQELDVGSGD